jgi:predicted metal-dependent enzyme (double-stranded beta helix superfamily)
VSATPFDRPWTQLVGTAGAVWRTRRERAAVVRFAAEIDSLDLDGGPAEPARARIRAAAAAVAERVDVGRSAPSAFGYGRRVLHQDPAGRWSLATITFRPGQKTAPHDHDGWGCAVVVRGVERERRFAVDPAGRLTLTDDREYAPGDGYAFDPEDVHQVIGAAPDRATVALHVLFHGRPDRPQRYRETAATE